jgi:predicted hydrocarbon binding protein
MISYTSERRLCDLLEGLVLGTGRHFGERLTVEHVQCMERGDVGCAVLVEPSTPDSSSSPPR